MANTHPRTLEDRGGVSLYLLRSFRSAAVVVLVLLSSGVIVHGQALAVRNPRDLLVDEPAAFIELLEAARPASVSMEDMGAILRALPPEGEITRLAAPAQQKVDAVRQLLTSTRREWYEIKVIDLPQAAVGLHARAVVLISAPAIALLSTAELQAMVAHAAELQPANDSPTPIPVSTVAGRNSDTYAGEEPSPVANSRHPSANSSPPGTAETRCP